MKILHVCPRPSFSGLEAYALAMAKGQKDLGHDVGFVVLADSPLARKCEEAGLATQKIQDTYLGRMRFMAHAARLLAGKDAPEILHLHSTQDLDLLLPALALARSRRNRTRIILQTHIWISHTKKDPLHAIPYALVDEVWCSSEPARATLEKYLPIAKNRIRVINYGREVAQMEQAFLDRATSRLKLSLPEDAIVVGTVARIDEGKGTRELLEASLEEMAINDKLHLLLIGPPTADDPRAIEYANRITARIAALPAEMKSRVHAPGAVPDSFKLLKAFDLFALPTYKECFALSLLEAQLAGVPCLAANSGGSPEVVRENKTGWLFEPRSVESLHQCLHRALSERSTWPRFGETARERVRQEFDFQKILPTTIEAYREALER